MNANMTDSKLVNPTEESITPEEQDAIVTLVIIVIGIIVAMIILFSMGIFIDCKHQKEELVNRKRIKLKMPNHTRNRRAPKSEDVKSLASEMCPTGASDIGFNTRDAVV